MEITGKITHVLEEKTGEGANGAWVVQGWVLEETGTQYPKSIHFEAFNKNFTINQGDEVTVGINAESREYNGRWYTGLKAWKVDFNSKAGGSETPPTPPAENQQGAGDDSDLPF